VGDLYPGKKRYTMGGDDEVIMQTPYDDDEGIFSAARSGSSYGVPPLHDRNCAYLRNQQ
jgi:hypothetical protein